MRNIDVLIIGAGPAGAAAAIAAADAGAKVLVIERKRQIGEPAQCGEFVPAACQTLREAAHAVSQRITGMVTELPSGERHRRPFLGATIDRGAFDRALMERARGLGADLQTATALVGLHPSRRRAVALSAAGRIDLDYRVLIAADGPRSTVARLLGQPPLPTAHTRQYTVPLRRPLQEVWIWLSQAYPGGYGWLFPKGDRANLGIGVDKSQGGDLKVPLERRRAQLIAEGLIGATISRRTGGEIPLAPRARLVAGKVIFAGDAAGLTHPVTGAGIAPAVLSGQEAGEAAVAFLGGAPHALTDYEEEVRQLFGRASLHAVRRREWLAERVRAGRGDDESFRHAWVAFEEYYQSLPTLEGVSQ